MHVFFSDVYDFRCHVWVFNPFWVFLCMVWKNSPFVSFTSSCPVFPTPFIEDAISSPSNMHASFVIDWLLHKHGFTSGLYIVREFGIVRRIGSHPSLNVLWNSLWSYLTVLDFWIFWSLFYHWFSLLIDNQSVHIFYFFPPNSALGDCVFPGIYPFFFLGFHFVTI